MESLQMARLLSSERRRCSLMNMMMVEGYIWVRMTKIMTKLMTKMMITESRR
jgi:hypothetical protein